MGAAGVNRGVRRFVISGFTLLEMMAATAILVVLMLVIFQITQTTGRVWKKSTMQISSLQNARAAFESMTRRLSQATLNVYYGYDDLSDPRHYLRRSELHFICGNGLVEEQITGAVFFQAPLGYTDAPGTYGHMENGLNACGYYVKYGEDPAVPEFLQNLANPLPKKYRFRLMEYFQPTQKLGIYTPNNGVGGNSLPGHGGGWIQPDASNTRVLAENVVALIVMPMLSTKDLDGDEPPLSSDFWYDSREGAVDASGKIRFPQGETTHQLPPILQVTMVVIDEDSAIKMGNPMTAPNLGLTSLFQQTSKLPDDISALEKVLSAKSGNIAGNGIPLNYYVFQTNVAIRGAKWSATPTE